jgi:hypothetical protein
MDLLTALKILARQWPVVVVGLLLTVVGVVQVGSMVAPQYEAKGTVLLLSPGAGVNPYLEFPAGLEVTADALVVGLQTPSGVEQAEAAGAVGTYSLERTTGPLVDITGHAVTADGATDTVDAVVGQMRAELVRLQEGSAPEEQITVEVLSSPTAEPKMGSRIRAQAATLAAGLVVTVAAGMSIDALRRQRREARARREAGVDADEDAGRPRPGDPAGGPPSTVGPSGRSWRVPNESERQPAMNGNGNGIGGGRGPAGPGGAGRPVPPNRPDLPDVSAPGRGRSEAYPSRPVPGRRGLSAGPPAAHPPTRGTRAGRR